MTDCYKCEWRKPLVGNCHSSCNVDGKSSFLTFIESMILKATPKIDEHGAKNGWATWPLDFDPIWISDCPYFKGKETTDGI